MAVAQLLAASLPRPAHRPSPASVRNGGGVLRLPLRDPSCGGGWAALQRELDCRGRFSCLFSDGRKQEQAKKALESALGGKKSEFEKWNKEIEKREEIGGGGTSGRGGWFGGGGWFGWFNNEQFWEESQQALIAILGIVFLYLLITKGDVMFAVIFNSLLYALRGTRNLFTSASSFRLTKIPSLSATEQSTNEPHQQKPVSYKDRVAKKWGTD